MNEYLGECMPYGKKNIVKQEMNHPILGYFVLNSMFRDQLFGRPFSEDKGGERMRFGDVEIRVRQVGDLRGYTDVGGGGGGRVSGCAFLRVLRGKAGGNN